MFCVGGSHYSGTVIFDSNLNKNGGDILVGKIFKCNINNTMAVSDETMKD